jgi:hypothetical protein
VLLPTALSLVSNPCRSGLGAFPLRNQRGYFRLRGSRGLGPKTAVQIAGWTLDDRPNKTLFIKAVLRAEGYLLTWRFLAAASLGRTQIC